MFCRQVKMYSSSVILGADIAPVRNAKFLLCKYFCGQAVAIPAPNALYPLAFHGLVARHGVFDDAGRQRAVVRHPIINGWAIR